MKRLSVLGLSAAVLASAAAHAQTVDPPEKWEDTPDARLNLPNRPQAGVSWQTPAPAATPAPPAAPAPGPAPQAASRPAPPPAARPAPAPVASRPAPPPAARPAPAPVASRPTPPPPAARPAPPVVAERAAPAPRPPVAVAERPAPPPSAKAAPQHHAHHASNDYADYRRVDRGGQVDRYWSGDDYRVRDPHRYGFAPPHGDERWVRYYDDALLVDRRGTVRDGRYGLDWDQYGDGWGYDDRGIPAYVGDGDFYPDEQDYAWVEDHDPRGPAYGYAYEGGAPAYPYGYGYYPYGYYYAYGPVTITETTVTTEPVVTKHTYYVDKVVRHTPKRKLRKVKAKAVPYPGERG
ncbi:RcnB family protein [Allosphingosinicella indica]|uniref:Nickel/cobalt transporter regulator n=1 Tax=Allosphingosinicella indica TaxID=941907 RepID=A0A1X7G5K2_9SPHN|nr:RcnB family protein [Allosphingosinicella indica]SMF64404.1 Nickel/cobalt transporter regulator [Allosphingosinicella indica]